MKIDLVGPGPAGSCARPERVGRLPRRRGRRPSRPGRSPPLSLPARSSGSARPSSRLSAQPSRSSSFATRAHTSRASSEAHGRSAGSRHCEAAFVRATVARPGAARLFAGRPRQQPERCARLGPRPALPRRARRQRRPRSAIVAAVYPAVWGAGQLRTGWLSDHTGRKPLIAAGMLVQAGALALLVAGGGDVRLGARRGDLARRRARRSSTRR